MQFQVFVRWGLGRWDPLTAKAKSYSMILAASDGVGGKKVCIWEEWMHECIAVIQHFKAACVHVNSCLS